MAPLAHAKTHVLVNPVPNAAQLRSQRDFRYPPRRPHLHQKHNPECTGNLPGSMVFRALREVGRQVRDAAVDGIRQQQQQRHQQQQQISSQWQAHSQQQFQHGFTPGFHAASPSPSQLWPLLILPSKAPTSLFSALLDAIFTLSLPADTSNRLELLTPTRVAAVYDELGYPMSDNLPFLLHRQAQASGDGNPKPHVNEAMKMAWRIFGLEYTEASAPDGTLVPGLTRKGFKDMMVRDALIYPIGQAAAWNGMIAKHRGALTAMGIMLPSTAMGPEAFMPQGVGPTGDAEAQARYKERRDRWTAEYKTQFGSVCQPAGFAVGPGGNMGGMDVGMAMQMQNWKHRMTMDAMTPGYRVDNGYGGYNYVYTGGLNW